MKPIIKTGRRASDNNVLSKKSAKAIRKLSTLAVSTLALNIGIANAGDIIAFGDSQLDTRRLCPLGYGGTACSNGAGVLEYIPEFTNLRFDHALNYAVGGAGTGDGAVDVSMYGIPGIYTQTNTQITEFFDDGRSIGPNDVVFFSALTNNHTRLLADPNLTGEALADQSLSQNLTSITRLADAGARNILLYGGGDVSVIFGEGMPEEIQNKQRIFGTKYVKDLPAALRPLAEQGVQIRYFDRLSLYPRIAATPEIFGFANGIDKCGSDPACRASPEENQNTYFLWDVHPTTAGFRLLARYEANLLGAQDEIPIQGQLLEQQPRGFTSSLMNRLDGAIREPEGKSRFNFYAYDQYSEVETERGVSSATAMPDASVTSASNAFIVGMDYFAGSGMTFGAALNKSNGSGNYKTGNKTELDMVQLAGYGIFNRDKLELAAILSYGSGEFDIRRAGVIDTLSASPDAMSFSSSLRGAYLFDAGRMRIGPIAQIDYSKGKIDAYVERGDSILTQVVDKQEVESLTGSIGVKGILPYEFGGRQGRSFFQLSLVQDFADGDRKLTTEQTSLRGLPIYTDLNGRGNDTFGRGSIGFSVPIAQSASLFANGTMVFGRDSGDTGSISAGVQMSF